MNGNVAPRMLGELLVTPARLGKLPRSWIRVPGPLPAGFTLDDAIRLLVDECGADHANLIRGEHSGR